MSKPKRPPLVQRLKDKLKNNPKVNLVDMDIPLSNGEYTPRLKEVLEGGEVDDKYYLNHDKVKKIIEETDFTKRLVSIKVDKHSKELDDQEAKIRRKEEI